jgi:hypothetical protein
VQAPFIPPSPTNVCSAGTRSRLLGAVSVASLSIDKDAGYRSFSVRSVHVAAYITAQVLQSPYLATVRFAATGADGRQRPHVDVPFSFDSPGGLGVATAPVKLVLAQFGRELVDIHSLAVLIVNPTLPGSEQTTGVIMDDMVVDYHK